MGHPLPDIFPREAILSLCTSWLGRLQFLVTLDFPRRSEKNSHAADLFAPPDNGGGKVDRHLFAIFIDKGHAGGI